MKHSYVNETHEIDYVDYTDAANDTETFTSECNYTKGYGIF